MKLTILALAALAALAHPAAAAEVKIALDSKPDLKVSGSYVWAHAFGEALAHLGDEMIYLMGKHKMKIMML